MSFLNLIFLWGLPLLSVPVAIHLLSRRRQEVVKWGAMQFLMDSSIRRRKIWRLDDLILMLLRTLAVALLIFALARPLWHGSNLSGGSSRDVIVVWDTSLSMGRKIEGGTPFEKMLERSEELFSQLGPTDTLRGMITVGRGEWLTSEPAPANDQQKNLLLDRLKKTGITEGSADWFGCLETALRVAVPQQARARLVVVLSDGQAHGWRQEDQASWLNLVKMTEESKVPTAIEINNVVGVTPPAMNLAIDKLSTTRQLIGKGETISIEAMVKNHGYTPVESATLEWMLGEKSIGKTTVERLGVGQSTKATLQHIAGSAGIERLSCRLGIEDELTGDNEQFLILETVEHVPLLLVDDAIEDDPLKTDRGYILAALGQDKSGKPTPDGESLFQVTTISTSELTNQSLSAYRGIIFPNLPSLDDAASARLTDFVRQGGGVWLALGDQTKPDDFNKQIYRNGGGLSPLPIDAAQGDPVRREEFLTIHPPAREHPATILLSDTQRLDIDRAKVFQRFPFVIIPARGEVPVLLESGTGEAMAIEGFLGRGRVIVQGIPMGVKWSNVPLMQAYVPMVHEWLWYLIQPTGVSHNLQAGEPLQVALPANEHIQEITLTQPGGTTLPMTLIHQGEKSIAQSRRTSRPGLYEAVLQIEGKSAETRPYQVARVPEESDLDQWPQELTARWREFDSMRVDPTTALVMPKDSTGQSTGEPLWTSLLVLVVILLIGELWLAGRMAKKRFGFKAEDQPGSLSLWNRLLAFPGRKESV